MSRSVGDADHRGTLVTARADVFGSAAVCTYTYARSAEPAQLARHTCPVPLESDHNVPEQAVVQEWHHNLVRLKRGLMTQVEVHIAPTDCR